MNSNERSYSFVARTRNKASVCANAKGSNSVPSARVKPTRSYYGLGYTAVAACLVSIAWLPQRIILAFPVLSLSGMAKCNGFARVGLVKANAVDATKSKPGQPCSLVCLAAYGQCVAGSVQYVVRPLFVRSKLVHIWRVRHLHIRPWTWTWTCNLPA
jgi:hypothetical protein